MAIIQLEKLRQATVVETPFPHLIVPGFVSRPLLKSINETFPAITKGGSYPIELLNDRMAVTAIIRDLESKDFEQAVSEKFGVDLSQYPKMFSLRGYTRARDGAIHTDSKDKIVTVLLYLNERWDEQGGRLRLLHNDHDLENYAAEVVPDNGTLLIFLRSDRSWHGHLPFEGQRRAIQMNWMRDGNKRLSHVARHKLSSIVKRAAAAFGA